MSNIFVLPKQVPITPAGSIYAGAKATFSVTGTSTPKDTYTTAALNVAHPNPVIADSGGTFPAIFLDTSDFEYRLTLTNSADVLLYTVDNVGGTLTQAEFEAFLEDVSAGTLGEILFPRTAEEISAGVTPLDYSIRSHDGTGEFILSRYGGDPTGFASSHTAWNNMMAVVAEVASGGTVIVPPGDYLFTSQIVLTTQDQFRINLMGYGASFRTSGVLSCLIVSGGTTNGGVTISGFQFKHVLDASAYVGVEVIGTSRTRFVDCHFRAGGVNSNYACLYARESTPGDENTGSFWLHVERCNFRRSDSSDGTRTPKCIYIEGGCNAARIVYNEITDADTLIQINNTPGFTYMANGVLIQGNNLETFTTGIRVDAAAAAAISGLRIVDSRIEPGNGGTPSTLLILAGGTVQPSVPTHLSRNYSTPDLATYINNPNSINYVSYDSWANPVQYPHLDLAGPIVAKNFSGNLGILDVQTGLDGSGIILRDQDGNIALQLQSLASDFVQLLASDSTLRVLGIDGLSSGTSTTNLKGSATFAAATSVSVGFATAEADTAYEILLGPQANKTFWVTSKTVNGFTLNASSASSDTVSWFLIR